MHHDSDIVALLHQLVDFVVDRSSVVDEGFGGRFAAPAGKPDGRCSVSPPLKTMNDLVEGCRIDPETRDDDDGFFWTWRSRCALVLRLIPFKVQTRS